MRRLLIIGCGDIGLRVARAVAGRYRIYGLTHSPRELSALRASNVTPILGDLDRQETLASLAGIAHDVVHCAPPQGHGTRDQRTAWLIAALAKGESLPQHLVYLSTSGVYGDCGGALVDETRAVRPQTERALRRADAERQLRTWGRRSGVRITLLRAPGIYAADRLPIARLQQGTPALQHADDAYINHIHADDLARLVVAALYRGAPNRSYNAVDDAPQKMGDYFDLVADHFGLPRPPRVTRAQAEEQLPPHLLSFMRESRRLANGRMKRELRCALRYPSVYQGVEAAVRARALSPEG